MNLSYVRELLAISIVFSELGKPLFKVVAFKGFGNHKGVDYVIFVQVFCKFLLNSQL